MVWLEVRPGNGHSDGAMDPAILPTRSCSRFYPVMLRMPLKHILLFMIVAPIGCDTSNQRPRINVFSPGNLHTCSKLAGVRFSTPILESIERKVEIRREPSCSLDNLALSVL